MERLVHIIPLGWERDRAVRPVLEMRAHRVYLISRHDSPWNLHFLKTVRGDLRKEVKDEDVQEIDVDATQEFESVLLGVARTIVAENAQGSRVHLNMSASGKIASAAATLAGMYHWDKLGRIYYARQEDYTVLSAHPKRKFEENGLSIGYKGTITLPRFQLQAIKVAAVQALAILYERGALALLDLMKELSSRGIEPFDTLPKISDDPRRRNLDEERELLAWSARLRRLVLKDLLERRLVRQTARGAGGKVRIVLERDGEFQALVSGLVERLRPPGRQ